MRNKTVAHSNMPHATLLTSRRVETYHFLPIE